MPLIATAMGTSDGISTEDWDVVHELAVRLVNTDGPENDDARGRLFAFLDLLEGKYGRLPSIIATRADYVEDGLAKEQLFAEALASAESLRDAQNVLHVTHSLAEMYLRRSNVIDAGLWLARLKERLLETSDSFYEEDYTRMAAELERLILARTQRGRAGTSSAEEGEHAS